MNQDILHESLYDRVLLAPPRNDPRLDKFFVVSGYATSAMAFHHLNDIPSVDINLICGMAGFDGISLSNHKGFCKLSTEDFAGRFRCSYIYKGIPVHSKLYIWGEGEIPRVAFLGSANYTQSSMYLGQRRESIVSCAVTKAFAYYQSIIKDSIVCTDNDVPKVIRLYADEKRKTAIRYANQKAIVDYAGLEYVKVPLLGRNGVVAERSGLNWGQRPEAHRDPNQAYIRLPASIYSTDFFPRRTVHFTILTDDEKTFVCARAQDNAKAIHTPHDNSLLGKYFRSRLGVASGVQVTLSNLLAYGRTDIDFYKIDPETYYMDFSIRKKMT